MKKDPKEPVVPQVVQPVVQPAPQPIVQPMIDELTGRCAKPVDVTPPATPPKPAETDQDAGSGYNPDHTIPQE